MLLVENNNKRENLDIQVIIPGSIIDKIKKNLKKDENIYLDDIFSLCPKAEFNRYCYELNIEYDDPNLTLFFINKCLFETTNFNIYNFHLQPLGFKMK